MKCRDLICRALTPSRETKIQMTAGSVHIHGCPVKRGILTTRRDTERKLFSWIWCQEWRPWVNQIDSGLTLKLASDRREVDFGGFDGPRVWAGTHCAMG